VANRGWKRRFDEPIPLPRGRQLVTLKDAADYIMKLPKAERNAPQWQTAVRILIGAAESRDAVMHAHIAMLQALHHGKPDRPRAPRRKRAKAYKIVR
jgi:hypothetical protein